METVIKQHNLDIEALMLSRLPVADGTQIGDSTSLQLAGKTSFLVSLTQNRGKSERERERFGSHMDNNSSILFSAIGMRESERHTLFS